MIVGAQNGTGKSSMMVTASITAGTKVGIISCEDSPLVLGGRYLSAKCGVNSIKIRKGELTKKEEMLIQAGQKELEDDESILMSFQVGASLDEVLVAARQLGQAGCKTIWLDYIQKIRGFGQDRRNEVAMGYTKFQRACWETGAVPVVLSQLSRECARYQQPGNHHLKETGDLENEARVIWLGWEDKIDPNLTLWWCSKCSYEKIPGVFKYKRDSSGTLRYEKEHGTVTRRVVKAEPVVTLEDL